MGVTVVSAKQRCPQETSEIKASINIQDPRRKSDDVAGLLYF